LPEDHKCPGLKDTNIFLNLLPKDKSEEKEESGDEETSDEGEKPEADAPAS